MEAHPEGPAGQAPLSASGDVAARRRGGEIIPLAALTITTLLLAASALRVVASSIRETPPIVAAEPPRPLPPLPGEMPACPLLALNSPATPAEDPLTPPVPSLATNTPPPPRPSAARVAAPTPVVPDRTPQAPPPPVEAPMGVGQTNPPPPKPAALTTGLRPAPKSDARRVMVRDEDGQPVVARILGKDGERTAVLLPDGQVAEPDGLIYTESPFVPMTKEALRDRLLAREFAGFHAITTPHYVVLFQGTKSFAKASASLLESLYSSLAGALNRRDVPVHEAEFPLVAVIFNSEDDFRRHKRVASEVQAYYEILSNRIFLFEKSRRDQTAPEVSALRKPQTVAHEGAHQILQNIGVQQRLSGWPLLLVEGLAEYCASTKIARNGSPTWSGLGQVNLIHIATLRDLEDPLATAVPGAKSQVISRDPKQPLVEYLVTRTELTPTDYALSWALAYHLVWKRIDDFLDYVREMSKLGPFERRTPAEHLVIFKKIFGPNLGKLGKDVAGHLGKLRQIDALPYYAVMFEQALGNGMVRRAAMVSQSPLMIRQWIDSSTNPTGGEPRWQVLPHPSRNRAMMTAEQWVRSG
ncbi:MAG TPA: DUF1570 domain-containing protein [Isosphaeraceae bacterium]